MGTKKPARVTMRTQVVPHQTTDQDSTERMLGQLADQAATSTKVSSRIVRVVSLVVGANRIAHGLGRRAQGVTVVPTAADATFAWSFAADGDKYALITVVGVAQPDSPVEFW